MDHPLRAAHFLLHRELAGSPPNEAIISALLELGLEVDLFAPGGGGLDGLYDHRVRLWSAEYGRRWLLRNIVSQRWPRYALFSGTSEDPLAVAGVLARRARRPFVALVDEIKSGSYYGDAPESWKKLCRWAIRSSQLAIVNDESRLALLRDYASLPDGHRVMVYPGAFRHPPAPADRQALRAKWGIPADVLTLAVSGGFNETAGADWLFETFQGDSSIHLVIQAVNLSPFTRLLLQNLEGRERLYLEPDRLSWQQAWSSAAACDIGLAIYRNTAPQFQSMGISSNRLCMFLCMGVPVIASRQSSFDFLEQYDCGRQVGNTEEFRMAVQEIRKRLPEMRANALRCAREYIRAEQRWLELKNALAEILRR